MGLLEDTKTSGFEKNNTEPLIEKDSTQVEGEGKTVKNVSEPHNELQATIPSIRHEKDQQTSGDPVYVV